MPRWFAPPAGVHARPSPTPATGQGLAGLDDPGAPAPGRRVDELTGERRDARQVAQEVERSALAREHGAQRSLDATDRNAGCDAVAVGRAPGDPHAGGRAARRPRWHRPCRPARRPRERRRPASRGVARQERGTDVAERAEVVGDGAGSPPRRPCAVADRASGLRLTTPAPGPTGRAARASLAMIHGRSCAGARSRHRLRGGERDQHRIGAVSEDEATVIFDRTLRVVEARCGPS